MTNVEDLLEFWHALDLASAQHIGQSLESRHLELDLNLVDWLALGGHSNTETIMAESCKTILVDCLVGGRVVEVVEGHIPV